MDKVLIATGVTNQTNIGNLKSVVSHFQLLNIFTHIFLYIELPYQVVSLTNSSWSCNDVNIGIYDQIYAAFGGIFYSDSGEPVPLACGGKFSFPTSGNSEFNECYNLKIGNNKKSSLQPYAYSGYTWLQNGKLVVTGGINEHEAAKDITYLVGLHSMNYGAFLTYPNYGHCMVTVTAFEQVFSLGGLYSQEQMTWKMGFSDVHSTENNWDWQQGPDLLKPRHFSSCGVISDTDNSSKEYVVIASGYGDLSLGWKGTSEFMEIGTTYFIEGPDLPTPVYKAASITTQNSLILYGGLKTLKQYGNSILDTVYVFQCWSSQCEWRPGEDLARPRFASLAMLVPDSVLSCNK